MKIFSVLFLLVLLGGCASSRIPRIDAQDTLDARRYQVVIPAHDGGDIVATLWQPALKQGEQAPLVMHTHGFGLRRMNGGVGLYDSLLPSGQIAKELWRQGFWLLTWNQRGHGGTDGVIDVMNPEREGQDLITLLDWAETNIPRLARDGDGDMLVGMVGESYGGGVQLLGTMLDPRIDAVVPMTTWYDLETALAPGDVPKGGWIKVLKMMADWVNFRKLDPQLRAAFSDAMAGHLNDDIRRDYASHSMRYYCEQGQAPGADALIIQGLRDVLFDPQQALAMRACFRRAGREVTLVLQQGGHLLPMAQHSPSMPVWYLDPTLHCATGNADGATLETEQVAVDWLRARLTGEPGPVLPSICLSNRDWGVALNEWPDRHEQFTFASVRLQGKRSGSWRWLTAMVDWFAGWQTEARLAREFDQPRDSGLRPAFVPLYTAMQSEKRFGTPWVTLASASPVDVPVLAALVHRKAGKASLKLVNDQLAPVAVGATTAMTPMAVALEPGDQLGLVLFSRHDQFDTLPLDFGAGVNLTGSVALPLSLQQLQLSGDAALVSPQHTASTVVH